MDDKHNKKLKEVSDRLEYISDIHKVIVDVSASFKNINSLNVDQIMTSSLEKIGKIMYADRAYLFTYNFSTNTMDNTHEWCNENIAPEINNLQDIPISYYLEGWVNQHLKKQTVLISDLEEIDPTSNIYKVLYPQGIKSLITLPIFVEHECYGFIGFDAIKQTQSWKELMNLFLMISEVYASVFTHDKITREIEEAKVESKAAGNVQSDFVAKVTHELRTPINGVSNALYLIQDSGLNLEQEQYVKIMEYSLDVLTSMVNNILDYSKIEKNKLLYKSSEINLENEIIKIISVNKYMANSKGIGLYLDYDYSVPTIITTDIEKLRQILNNLIINAIKYTNYGHVKIKVSVLQKEGLYNDIKFEIIDTGIGISQENLNSIFEEFYQVGDELNKSPQGTGLGLAITREFLHFLKSELYVESTVKEGSNFNFELKLHTPSNEDRLTLEKSALIIDMTSGEHSNIQAFLSAQFSQVDVSNVRNCRLAIREPYDMVFVYTSNEKNFLEMFSKVKPILQKVKNRMEKILLFDDVKTQSFVSTLEHFDRIIEIPCSSEMFIERITTSKQENIPTEILEETKNEKKQKILLVDDNNINRRVMSELLKGMYLDVKEASDGFEAIELVKQENFNMIFMDIFMPGMDGYETSKKIRELEGVKGSIPIIAVTANDVEETRDKVVECGMNGVLSKPLRKDNLEKLLNEYFSNIINAVDEDDEELPVFNQNEFELFYEESFLRVEIIDTFINDKQSDLSRITEAFKAKDCDLIYKAFHYLKSSFTYLKATKILKVTSQILELADDKKLNEVLLLESPVLTNYDALIKALEEYKKSL
ncbi:response regulator [Candidatus Izimaplasma bacterium]|nr:response regulator [Candidatus Izimaplasma bacterium]